MRPPSPARPLAAATTLPALDHRIGLVSPAGPTANGWRDQGLDRIELESPPRAPPLAGARAAGRRPAGAGGCARAGRTALLAAFLTAAARPFDMLHGLELACHLDVLLAGRLARADAVLHLAER